MTQHKHASHPQITARLKRAHGHLAKVIAMLEDQAPCTDTAQQLFAVEKAITNAKRVLIHDHIDHCLSPADDNNEPDVDDFKAITKYL
ncbi:metal-sensing transcriptional repressor [Ruegeria sp. Ofav3-42]|uniref:metal-sensing transcriptional repressor n=1 Tax=Ruegeria sp. Ofav3-42 TaxID=2917759 RepID=UPI001EF543A4|nr:metal-sensing transcriptional repressor [Ruegeria sp. Ofav3-42]MCG7521712.1 metal-sensing transcriptional repressor [Ruegeria sp. Ofav3-42]